MLTDDQRNAVAAHHEWMIATAENTLATLRRVPPADRGNQLNELIAYWRHGLRFAKWSRTFIGKKLKAGKQNAISEVQRPS